VTVVTEDQRGASIGSIHWTLVPGKKNVVKKREKIFFTDV
jgi:hypothetical protein